MKPRGGHRALLIVAAAFLSGCRATTPVWIDTDPAIGLKDRDVDDGLALVQAFHSRELVVRGVSAVYGNTDLEHSHPIARELVARFGPANLSVYSGATSAADLGRETDASLALAKALREERLSILALGPVTNIATVLRNHPDLASQVVEIVAVAGRRPGQRFTTGTVNRKGHRDFNFEQDPEGFRILLGSPVAITLAPFEVSSKIWIEASDLDRLAAGGPAGRYLADASRGWLKLWKDVFDVPGFNPFDTLAVGYLTSPHLIRCEPLNAEIKSLPDDVTETRMQGSAVAEKPYLIASSHSSEGRRVRYCYQPDPSFKADLLRRLENAR